MRCAIYARVSTELDSQRTSLDNQIDIFRNYAAQHNWEIVEVYTDKQSGTKGNRPGLKALIEDGKAGLFDVILAKELSRLARNGGLSYELRDICRDYNIHIVCLDNSINTVTGNVHNFGLFAWLYENESTNSSRRNKQAKRVKSQRGLFIGSNPPYGYHSDQGKLIIREDETPEVVRRIYRKYLAGKGMDSIAKVLTTEKVATPSQIAKKSNASNLWHASTIKNILNNRHYCGDLVQNRTETISVTTSKRRDIDEEKMIIHENTHEPIIGRDIYQTIQKMRQGRSRTTTAPKKHLFTNIIYCEECKKSMWFKANQKGYRCGGNIKHGTTICHNKKPIREKELKQVIIDDLRYLLQSFQNEVFLKNLLSKLNKKKQQIQTELQDLDARIINLRKKKLEFVNLYTEKLISKEELIEYKDLTDEDLKNCDISKSQLLKKLEECTDQNYTIDLRSKLREFLTINTLTPQVLHSLVSKITCSDDGSIHIQYNFVNPFQEKKEVINPF
ncbi:recombinase family protein [Sporosarcina sp. CAU 1771]